MSKKAIVTGGGSGLGRGIALGLAREGYDLAISYSKNEAAAAGIADQIRATGRRCTVFQADFRKKTAPKALFEQCIVALDGLDLLVNNAALAILGGELFDLSDETLDDMFLVNLRAYLILLREGAQYMVANGVRGSLVNITSVHAESVWPDDGIYGGYKAAVARAARSFALSLAPHGIRVNNVAPGMFRSKTREEATAEGIVEGWDEREQLGRERVPMGRIGEPDELAALIAFLASERGSYITGQTLTVDGGLMLPNQPEDNPYPDAVDLGWGYLRPRR